MGIVVVDGGVLAGGDTLNAVGALNRYQSVGLTLQTAGMELGCMANLELYGNVVEVAPDIGTEVMEPHQGHLVPVGGIGVVTLGDIQDVLLDVLAHNEPR